MKITILGDILCQGELDFPKNKTFFKDIEKYLSDDKPKYSYVKFKNAVENGKIRTKKVSEEKYVQPA